MHNINFPLLFSILLSVCFRASCFKWQLTDTLPPQKVLTFSERYMFATGLGPELLEQGAAYIHVDTEVTTYMARNISTSIGVAIFAASENHHHDSLEGICGDSNINDNYWAANVDTMRVLTTFKGKKMVNDDILGLNGTYYVWGAHIHASYSVNLEAWHNVAFQFCSTESSDAIAQVDGTVTFRNPYGFIPAELFGFLPFEGARMIAYVLFAVFFLYYYCKFWESTLRLHTLILLVFLVGLIEATTWYGAYQTINLTGQPYCCPFPTSVVAALVLQVFRQTFARVLLLIVSLGYGIVRPKLLPAEWSGISIISILYFIAAAIAQAAEIVLVHDVHENSPTSVIKYQMPEMLLDVFFLTWIYIALGSTIRILNDYRQTYKLLMYKQLAFTIAMFTALFGFVTVLILLDKFNIIQWPWQWSWVQQILWEVLNFAVLAAVCLICRPSGNSKLLSYASQLPTEDPDDYDFEEDDEDEEEEEYYKPRGRRSKGSVEMTTKHLQRDKDKGVFASLPSAEDEDYGLDDVN